MKVQPPRADICVLIPCFNEARHIRRVASATRPFASTVLVVDDGSTDATSSEAAAAGAQVLRLPRNQGKGAALKAGFAWAAEQHFAAAITLDGDGQHDPAEIQAFFDAYDQGACDIVIGNRMTDTRAMPRLRRWTNRLTSAAISRLAGQRLWDTQCGFRLIAIETWNKLKLEGRRYELETEVLIRAARAGARIEQVKVATIYAQHNESKIHPIKDGARILRLLWRCRKAEGLKR